MAYASASETGYSPAVFAAPVPPAGAGEEPKTIVVIPRNATTTSTVQSTTRSGHSSHLPPAPRQLPPNPGRAASDPSACMSATSESHSVSRARGRGRGEASPAESR